VALVGSVELVGSEVLEELAGSVELAESGESAELVAPDARVVSGGPVVRAESAGAIGQRSGSTTPSTAAEHLMEIEPRPIGSAA